MTISVSEEVIVPLNLEELKVVLFKHFAEKLDVNNPASKYFGYHFNKIEPFTDCNEGLFRIDVKGYKKSKLE